ncbi:MAG: NAD+ synthase [Roseibium sp.]|uniref:NAD+ synthase n=1 Tax=Roseibium sp. TaxID=1936156 RepID=UPI0032995BFB
MTRERLHLQLIQENPVTGDVSGNTDMVLKYLAKGQDADLLIFSECFLTGYPVSDLVLRSGFIHSVDRAIARIRDAVIEASGPAILVGAPQSGSNLPYNAAFLIEPTGSIRIVQKTELPNNDVFDERRTFAVSANARPAPLRFRGFNLGIQICEDMWHGDVSASLAEELADVLVVLNGSPYQRGKREMRFKNARARVRSTGLPLIYVNQVGSQDELVFDGASFTMGLQENVLEAKAFMPDVMNIDLIRRENGTAKIRPADADFFEPRPSYPDTDIASDYMACVLGLRDYIAKTGSPRVFVGVSGGLDSALVLAMAADAIGKERVVGVMMPSEHTGQESLDLADDLMTRLGVVKENITINSGFDVIDKSVTETASRIAAVIKTDVDMGVTRENFQARLRGMHLMGLSNALGGIVLSTGNKSESAVGYCTLYGDMVGGFNPLKSVYKSDAFDMARWRNAVDLADSPIDLLGCNDPIPVGIIDRPPSAELSDNQTDEAVLGSYLILDEVLRLLVEEGIDQTAVAAMIKKSHGEDWIAQETGGRDAHTYTGKIAALVRGAQYKRVQAPPGVKLNPTDFGLGWRYPIAGTYRL